MFCKAHNEYQKHTIIMASNPDQNHPSRVPFPNSYWVRPGTFLAGEYPGAKSGPETRTKLTMLLDMGIRTVINLMEENEVGWDGDVFVPYENRLKDLSKKRGIRVWFHRLSIKDFDIPSIQLMKQILGVMDRALKEDRPVYLHCLGGIGRTGTVVGCYLIQNQMATPASVLDTIKSLRANIPLAHRPSPETAPQREMVQNWKSL